MEDIGISHLTESRSNLLMPKQIPAESQLWEKGGPLLSSGSWSSDEHCLFITSASVPCLYQVFTTSTSVHCLNQVFTTSTIVPCLYQCSLPLPVFTTSTSIHYLYQCSLPLLVVTTSTVFITSTSHMFKEEKGGQDERNTKSCPWRGLFAYSGHWAGNKKGGTSHKAAEKAEITHQDMRGTMKILLLTTGEKGRAAGSQYIWEKIEKQSTSRQPLYHHRRGILLS